MNQHKELSNEFVVSETKSIILCRLFQAKGHLLVGAVGANKGAGEISPKYVRRNYILNYVYSGSIWFLYGHSLLARQKR